MQDVACPSTLTSVKNLKILIAEDDEIANFLLVHILQEQNPELLRARTGKEAVDICLNTSDIDIVLMDINMPEMNGYDATKQIREFNKDIIIIAQTSKTKTKDFNMAMSAGCNDFLPKPVSKQSLFSKIQQHIKQDVIYQQA